MAAIAPSLTGFRTSIPSPSTSIDSPAASATRVALAMTLPVPEGQVVKAKVMRAAFFATAATARQRIVMAALKKLLDTFRDSVPSTPLTRFIRDFRGTDSELAQRIVSVGAPGVYAVNNWPAADAGYIQVPPSEPRRAEDKVHAQLALLLLDICSDTNGKALDPEIAKIVDGLDAYLIEKGLPRTNQRLNARKRLFDIGNATPRPPGTRPPLLSRTAATTVLAGLTRLMAQHVASAALVVPPIPGPLSRFLGRLRERYPQMFETVGQPALENARFIARFLEEPSTRFDPDGAGPSRGLTYAGAILAFLTDPDNEGSLTELLEMGLVGKMEAAAFPWNYFPPPPPPPGGAALVTNTWPVSVLPTTTITNLPKNADLRDVPNWVKMPRAAHQAAREAIGEGGAEVIDWVKKNPGTVAAMGGGLAALIGVQFVPGVDVAVDVILGIVGAVAYGWQFKDNSLPNIRKGLDGFKDYLNYGLAGRSGFDMNKAKEGFKKFFTAFGVEAFKLLALLGDLLAVGKGVIGLGKLATKIKAMVGSIKWGRLAGQTASKLKSASNWLKLELNKGVGTAKHVWNNVRAWGGHVQSWTANWAHKLFHGEHKVNASTGARSLGKDRVPDNPVHQRNKVVHHSGVRNRSHQAQMRLWHGAYSGLQMVPIRPR